MLRLIQQQLVPQIHHVDRNCGRDARLYFDTVKKLQPIKDGVGDCVEVDFSPRNVRKYAYEDGIDLLIRRMEDGKFRIWRKS